jgi:HEPN domain-containing protein
MRDPVNELAREWLDRAERDLRVAEYLLTMPEPPPESIGFHAQQCAEKAIKSYLVLHSIRFERRHDLSYLIDLCVPLDLGFESFRASADELTPYAVEFRYPDTLAAVSVDLARATVDTARRIYTFVRDRLEQA